MHRTVTTLGVLLVAVASAQADGLVVIGGSPRAIGRAGTGTVGDDGGGALLVNPAALARRDGKRVQVGVGFTDDSLTFAPEAGPVAENQAAPSIAPLAAFEGSLGAWVIGVGVMTSAVTGRTLRPPSDLPYAELMDRFEYRYAGIEGSLRRDTLTVGLARRLGDSIALGISVAASRITATEKRRLWAGFDGREDLRDPKSDLEVTLSAHDNFAPSAVAGILIAPAESPIELGASLGWAGSIQADGGIVATGSPDGPTVQAGAATAHLAIRQPWTLRAGARYLGERFVVEVGADLWMFDPRAESTRWLVEDVHIRDPSGFTVSLLPVPSRISNRTHTAFRGALDVNLVEGFLWATTGYSYARGGTEVARLSPTFGDLGGHTFALGLEGTAGGVTVTVGWSRTWSTSHASPEPNLLLDNPFHAGDARVPGATYDGSIDQFGLVLDVELEPLP